MLAAGSGARHQPAFEPAVEASAAAAIPDWPLPFGGDGRLPSPSLNGRRETLFAGSNWVRAAYVCIDVCCVAGAAMAWAGLSSWLPAIRVVGGRAPWSPLQTPLFPYADWLCLYSALIVLFCEWQDLYHTPRARPACEEVFAVAKSVFAASGFLVLLVWASGALWLRSATAVFAVASGLALNTLLLAAWRYAKRQMVIRRVERGVEVRNVAIVGAGRVGQALARHLEENKLLGYRFKGFLDVNHSGDARRLGGVEDLARVARSEFLDEVFITIPSERELVKSIASVARQNRLSVKVVPDLYDGVAWNVPVRQVGDFPVLDLCWKPIPTVGLFCKRVFDVMLSGVGLLVCGPLLAVLAVWIRLESPGPALYRSRRLGKKGHAFTCYKLRTMVANADEMKAALRERNERQGPFFKMRDDPRVTPLGRFLRKYSVDELPQLWNVLRGEMSIVGPRPHPLDDCRLYTLDDLRRLEVKPGVTGLWQVTARQDPSFETNMALDLEYIESWGWWLDTRILWRTIPAVVRGLGQ